MIDKLIIVGSGRHAIETYYLIEEMGLDENVLGFADDNENLNTFLLGKKVFNINVLVQNFANEELKPSVIVSIGTLEVNKRLTSLFYQNDFPFFSAIHPLINVSRQRNIGKGVTIAQGSILTCNIYIDDFSIINIGCTISHDCTIGKNVNISPGCHLAGNVQIEDDVFLGTGVNVINKITIGKGSIVAAGACVIKDVPPYTMVAGVPAVLKKRLDNGVDHS
jgi:acetyltransferase EpsM